MKKIPYNINVKIAELRKIIERSLEPRETVDQWLQVLINNTGAFKFSTFMAAIRINNKVVEQLLEILEDTMGADLHTDCPNSWACFP